jgi:hypothetical protein
VNTPVVRPSESLPREHRKDLIHRQREAAYRKQRRRPPGARSKFFSWSAWLKHPADFADKLKGRLAKLPALAGKAQEISAIAQAAFEIHVVQRSRRTNFPL